MKHDCEDHRNQHKNSHKLHDEKECPFFEFEEKPVETETARWSEFPYGGKAIVEQLLSSEELNKSKRAGL